MIAITPDLLTHVALIDEQHKELFERINSVSAIGTIPDVANETERTLDFLGVYIAKHFSDEEDMMIDSGYPDYNWHHTWHQSYIAKFNSLKDEYLKNGISPEYVEILDKFIIGWILTHIGQVDVKLGKYINSKKTK